LREVFSPKTIPDKSNRFFVAKGSLRPDYLKEKSSDFIRRKTFLVLHGRIQWPIKVIPVVNVIHGFFLFHETIIPSARCDEASA